jgi:hypothetical protein
MKVGDKVEVINSSYWGYEIGWKGEVKVSKPSYGKFAIDVTFDNGKIITGCDSGNFKIVKEVNMGFAVGQKVKIIDSGSAPLDTKGLFGTIIGTGSGPKYWYVKVEGRGAGKDPNWYYHEDNIKIVKEEEKMMVFKKGDKVIARKDVTGFRFGCASGMEKARETQVTGIVQSERGHDGRYSVSFPTYSGTYQWHESELAYAEFDMVPSRPAKSSSCGTEIAMSFSPTRSPRTFSSAKAAEIISPGVPSKTMELTNAVPTRTL